MIAMSKKTFMAVAIISTLLISIVAGAQVVKIAMAEPRTIIVPDDYPTIASAIGNATNGDTIFVKAGTYEEHTLFINKTLALIGEDKNDTTIKNIDYIPWDPVNPFPPPAPVTLQISADSVKVSGFNIASGGVPISVSANKVQIVNNVINPQGNGISINGNNNTVTQNSISGLGNCFVTCSGAYNIVANNSMTGQTSNGLDIYGSFSVIIGNTLVDCGVFGMIYVVSDRTIIANNTLINSGSIQIAKGSNNTVYANRISRAGNAGLELHEGYNNILFANEAKNCFQGAALEPPKQDGTLLGNNTLYHNNFIDNTYQVSPRMYGTNYFDNGQEGNYWSDYISRYPNATETDHTGIGNIPYVMDANATDHYPLMAPFDVSTVIVQLPEWALPSSTPYLSPIPTVSSSPSHLLSPSQSPSPTPSSSINPSPSIPEFPSWITLPLLTTATLVIVLFIRRRTALNKS